jgi:hypothetical protein
MLLFIYSSLLLLPAEDPCVIHFASSSPPNDSQIVFDLCLSSPREFSWHLLFMSHKLVQVPYTDIRHPVLPDDTQFRYQQSPRDPTPITIEFLYV